MKTVVLSAREVNQLIHLVGSVDPKGHDDETKALIYKCRSLEDGDTLRVMEG